MSAAYVVPSSIIWRDIQDGNRVWMLPLGLTLAVATVISTQWLINRHVEKAKKQVDSSAVQLHFLPRKTSFEIGLIRLTMFAGIANAIQMSAPELGNVCGLFVVIYRAYSYYCLYMFVSLQFGGTHCVARDDMSGTLQRHEPYRLWAQVPCCCVWGPLWGTSLMQPKRASYSDLNVMVYMMYQYAFFGPLAAAVIIACDYGGINPDHRLEVRYSMFGLSIVSLMVVIYSSKCLIGLAEKCSYILDQAREHKKADFDVSHTLEETQACEEIKAKHNLDQKNGWISLVTATPQVASLIIGFANTDGQAQDNGDYLREIPYEIFLSGFVGICIAFVGSLVAWKVFTIREERDILYEFTATGMIAAEIYPAAVLEEWASVYKAIIDKRKANGIDPDLGMGDHLKEIRDVAHKHWGKNDEELKHFSFDDEESGTKAPGAMTEAADELHRRCIC